LQGIPVVVARSGWSKQGGYEVYLMDGARGTELWNLVREAGRPWDIGPGNPNLCERIESGLLSYGGDTDGSTNPFEVRLENYVDLDVEDDVVGIAALRRIKADGVQRRQLGVVLDGDIPAEPGFRWHVIQMDGKSVGHLTNCVWSYRMKKNIGFGLVASECQAGDTVSVDRNGQIISARLVELPFL
jgi:glycine cleavage system aminomethyltransferase T